MAFLTRYSHAHPVTIIDGVSMTQQQYRDECDIDTILRRYKVGQPLPATSRVGSYGDFTDFGDYQSCLERVRKADEDFASLPASLRARFGNDPVAYYQFVLDPSNQEECVKLGIRQKIEKPGVSPIKVEVVNPSSDDAGSTPAAPSAVTT